MRGRKLIGVLALTAGLMTVGTVTSSAAKPANTGDVWTDNVGNPPGPGHSQDPHLACANINLWGADLSGSSGSFTIDGWPPSGAQEQVYAAGWTYNTVSGGDQVTQVIDVGTLVSNAIAAGDAPVNSQGFHFKLQFSLFPQKHKTFWVKCGAQPAPQLQICQVVGQSIGLGFPFHFTLSDGENITVTTGAAPNGNCVTATGPFTVGEQVTITQTLPTSEYFVDYIHVNPTNRLVSENLGTASVTVTIGSGLTTVTYQDED